MAEIRALVVDAARQGLSLAICGGRHAIGGQQFAADAVLLDMRRVRRVLAFDAAAGLIEVEAGIEWPESIDYLEGAPTPNGQRWSIRQKQTRADRLSLGGCLAANIHGRGLRMRPFIFYLTYSRAASADQVRACYPNFAQFLEAKRRFDPQQRFQSNWYRTCFAPTCLIVRGRP